MNPARYRADIDGLRALAVISVVLFHLKVAVFSGGFVGVDVFFVISGFLITRLIRDEMAEGTFTFGKFYQRRARRLLPALFVTLFFTTLAAGIIFSPKDLVTFSISVVTSLFSLANVQLWLESGYFDASSDVKPLLHMWSLSIEEQFYLIWPVTLLFLMRKTPNRGPLIVCIAAALVSLILAVVWVKVDGIGAFYLLPFRVYEFMLGAGLVWLIKYQPKRKILLEPILLLGIAMILYCVFTYTKDTPFPSYNAVLPCLGAALVIYAGGGSRYARVLIDNWWMVGVGLVSYSFYLIHWPIIVFYGYLTQEPFTPFFQALMFFTALGLAILMYFYVEQPFRRAYKSGASSTKTFLQDCLIAALALCIPAATMYLSDGWQFRIKKEYRELVQDPKTFHLSHYGGVNYPNDTVIKFGDLKAAPSYIMFGDSFGMHYIHGINKIFTPKGHSVLATFYQGCFMAPGISIWENGVYKAKCEGDYEQAKKLMAGNNLPVIIGHSWHTYNGWVGNANGPYKFADLYAYYRYALTLVDSIIKDIGPDRRIILIGVPPGEDEKNPIVQCFTMPSYLGTDCTKKIMVPAQKANGFIFGQMMESFVKRYPNVTFINPYQAFCKNGMCRVMDGDKILYSDGAHLSIDGSDLFAEYFAKQLLGEESVGLQQGQSGVVLEQPQQQP